MNVRYLRLTIDAIASGSVWQISRLDFINSSETRFAYPSSTTVTANYGNFPSSEGILKMLDGSTSTKACCNNYSSQQIITIDLQSEALDLSVYNRWQWYTANDTSSNPGRNLKTFMMEVSVDGITWITLTSVVNGSYTSSNYSLAYRSPYIYEITADISPNGSGYITNLGLYEENTIVNIEAVGVGYWLSRWLIDGYTRLEYIEATGTQYIDTGLTAVSGMSFYTKCTFKASQGQGTVMAQGNSSNFAPWISPFRIRPCVANKNLTVDLSLNTLHEIEVTDSNAIIDNQTYSYSDQSGLSVGGNIWLFRRADSGYYGKATIQEFKIYSSGTLVRHYIPVIRHSDGVIGLFDLVHLKFYGNSGTGEFIGGNVYAS